MSNCENDRPGEDNELLKQRDGIFKEQNMVLVTRELIKDLEDQILLLVARNQELENEVADVKRRMEFRGELMVEKNALILRLRVQDEERIKRLKAARMNRNKWACLAQFQRKLLLAAVKLLQGYSYPNTPRPSEQATVDWLAEAQIALGECGCGVNPPKPEDL